MPGLTPPVETVSAALLSLRFEVPEAAQILRMSRAQLYNRIHNGSLKPQNDRCADLYNSCRAGTFTCRLVARLMESRPRDRGWRILQAQSPIGWAPVLVQDERRDGLAHIAQMVQPVLLLDLADVGS